MGIKIGLVGLGSFGSMFVEPFARHPLVDQVSLCDAEPEKLKAWAGRDDLSAKLNLRNFHTDFDEICRGDADALVIITQPWLHAPQCIQAMEAGKCVYSAVPIISLPDFDETLELCAKLIDTVRRTGRHYMLGETAVYRRQTMFCKRMAAAGEFGDFVFSEAEYVHDLDQECSLRATQLARTSGKIGSRAEAMFQRYADRGFKTSPMDYPTHSCAGPLSVMRTWAKRVSAIGYRNRNHDPYFRNYEFSNVTAFFHLENGVPLRIVEGREMAEITGFTTTDFRIYGTRGSFALDRWSTNGRTVPDGRQHLPVERELTDAEMRDELDPEVARALLPIRPPDDIFHADVHGGSHAYMVDAFVKSVVNDTIPEVNVWFASHLMAMGCAAHKSALHDGELTEVCDLGRPPAR